MPRLEWQEGLGAPPATEVVWKGLVDTRNCAESFLLIKWRLDICVCRFKFLHYEGRRTTSWQVEGSLSNQRSCVEGSDRHMELC